MKILIDTNVLLDVLFRREKFFDHSRSVLLLCEIGLVEAVVSAMSVPNIIYIMRKEPAREEIEKVLLTIGAIAAVEPLTFEDLRAAALGDFADFEDGVQHACALRCKADCIVTRNVKDFAPGSIPAISPKDFLEKFFG